MKPIKEMNQAELAAYVQNHLSAHGIEVVLSGGAVVGVYSNGTYVTKDIDLVNVQFTNRRKMSSAMREIGFIPVGRHFEHPESDQVIEFPPGPLSMGENKVNDINEISLDTGVLRALSPTDCVKDRLAHYYHWGDQQCLIQAQLVAANHNIDLDSVREWSIREGKEAEYEQIKDKLR